MANDIEEKGSPCMDDTKYLLLLDPIGIEVSESHKQLLNIGREQFVKFTREMYKGKSIFNDPQKRNKLPILVKITAWDICSSKSNLQSIKDD